MTAGTLYAISGEGRWIYYAQVTPDKRVGFFRRRDHELAEPSHILTSRVIAVIGVSYPSITRALRSGAWLKLGRFGLVVSLLDLWPMVQWPVGTLTVGVSAEGREYETGVEDPAIQDMELIASWDAEQHIPGRLTADFDAENAEWHVGGPIWRERRVKEEYAKRFPDAPLHQLPSDWVWTNAS